MKQEKKIIRIAQVVGKMNSGGVESFIMNYYRNIDRTKIQFDFIVDKNSILPQRKEIEKLGGKIFEISSYNNPIKYMYQLFKIFKNNKYKIVHSHMNALSVFPLFCAYITRVPIRIAHSHSTSNKNEIIKNSIKLMLRPFSKVFATDYFACTEHAGRWLFGNKIFNNGKVKVIPNSIDIKKFEYNEKNRKKIREELKIDDKFVIGNVGRFTKQKNHNFIINVFYDICKEDDQMILLLIGEGPLEEKIKEKVKLLNIENKVIFLGTTDKVDEYMQAMDVLFFPSLYEGLGMVTIEAQCSGLPCIVSKEVPKEVEVSDKVEFIDLNEFEKWKEKIFTISKEKGNRETDLNRIRERGFYIKDEAVKLEKIYINLINNRVNVDIDN